MRRCSEKADEEKLSEEALLQIEKKCAVVRVVTAGHAKDKERGESCAENRKKNTILTWR